MHPLLLHRRSLLAYLAFWVGLSALPCVLVRSNAPCGAALLAAGTTLAFALLTLPTWYLCRALPLAPGRAWRIVAIHTAGAAVWSFVFLLCAMALAPLVGLVPEWSGVPAEIDHAEGTLVGVGALFYLLVASFHHVLAGLEQRRDALEREGAMAMLAQRAELHALRAQVHPHFLFNALNTVSALCGYDAAKAREACLLLAEYLRGTLRAQDQALVPLADEWALCERYLKVEKLRFGERLSVEVELDDAARACLIPSLLLQPLVENAITHGVGLVDEPAPLRVRARTNGQRLAIELENGLDPAPRARDGGVGLANVLARLSAQYDKDARLRIERTDGRFLVLLDLPVQLPETTEAR